jgi:aromatic-L-amino-acid/L-tryptophan decarboxylase
MRKSQSTSGRRNDSDRAIGQQPAAKGSLDPSNWAEFRAQAHRMLDDMLDSIEHIREQRVWRPIPDEIRASFRQPLPAEPMPLAKVHEEFMTRIVPFTARNAHPGFFGWVQGAGTPVGMLAEMLAAGLNANVGGRDQIPLEVERQITLWMRELFQFPAEASGLLVSGSSLANFVAVKIARDKAMGYPVRQDGVMAQSIRLTAYASTAVHGCIPQALDLAGLGSASLRRIPVDAEHRMDLEALKKAIDADRAAGWTPFLVVGTAGTVDTGSIDDLAGMAALCAEQRLWFHVDGACGALGMLAPEIAPKLKGIERADSLAFDFHKWGQVPYDAGFLLVRDGSDQQQAFSSSAAYLSRGQRGLSAGSPWPCDLGPELSRGFRALKTWVTLKVYGAAALGEVIGHTCDLARYLEGRIRETPELELMAPVALNVVCFRYRPLDAMNGTADERTDELNHRIVVQLQESGAVAPSSTEIGGRFSIRAAIVNHRSTRAEIDVLLEAVLEAGRSLTRRVPEVGPDGQAWQPWFERNAKLEKINAQLGASEGLEKKTEADLRFQRAMLLTQLGRNLEARSEHLKVVALDPTHVRNLNALGLLLAVSEKRKAALLVLAEAVKQAPESLISRVNYGGVLLAEKDGLAAREQFEAALAIDPKSPHAHAGLFYALTQLGDHAAAEPHRRFGFGQKCLFPGVYKGNAQPISVLLLVSSTGGNIPIEKFLDDTVFQTHVLVADFYDLAKPLPAHQLVVNGIGDVDVSEEALRAAGPLLARTSAPVINPPVAVLSTSRCGNASRLGKIAGLMTAKTQLFSYAALAADQGTSTLLEHGFRFPLLLRVPGFHMGEHFIKVAAAQMLSSAVRELPGAGRAEAQLLAIQYLDARGMDGYFRKYRVMMIDGELYPLHLAISPEWKIHYFSADMADRPDHRAEEAVFLSDMDSVLGARAVAALSALQKELGLDYAGVDFGLSPSGEVLLFEANATMVVQPPDEGSQWDYRRPAVERIQQAVRRMLLSKSTARSVARDQTPLPACSA